MTRIAKQEVERPRRRTRVVGLGFAALVLLGLVLLLTGLSLLK